MDLHGEVASEKQALANMIDGSVPAVIGTHTHVPTSEFRVLPNGTAYQTDAMVCAETMTRLSEVDKNRMDRKSLI